MRKNLYALIMIAGVVVLAVSSVSAAPAKPRQPLSQTDQVQPGQAQPVQPQQTAQPDLTVKVTNIVGETYTGQGGTCRKIIPKATIFNRGKAVSGEFKIKLDQFLSGSWSNFASRIRVGSIAPRSTYTVEWGGAIQTVWCEGGTIGWRVIVDTENQSKESNENNNTAIVMYP